MNLEECDSPPGILVESAWYKPNLDSSQSNEPCETYGATSTKP